MIFAPEELIRQVNSLLAEYPNLSVAASNSECIRFQGSIFINLTFNDFTVQKVFDLQIVLPLANNDLPYVIDINDNIGYTYHHRYTNGVLCLATDTDVRFRFLDSFDVVDWMREFVETYYFSYEYYVRFGELPFGDRSHGYIGILESYREMLGSGDGSEVLRIMVAIATTPYRGHLPCPCGSGRKTRKCHGDSMLKFYLDRRKMLLLQEDLTRCLVEMEEYRARNHEKRK